VAIWEAGTAKMLHAAASHIAFFGRKEIVMFDSRMN
jgi:hypothetical protein